MAQKTLSEVLALPPMRWRIPMLLPERGMLVVGGAPKRGKSRLALDVARRLVQGRSIFGVLPIERAERVLVYNVEGGFEGVRAREGMFASMPPEDQERLCFEARPIQFTRPNGSERTEGVGEAVRAWKGFTVIVLDPLVHFRACDENNNQHSAALMRAIRCSAEEVGASVLIVHHARKSRDDDERGGEQLRGASAIFAAADNVLMLYKNESLLECAFDLRYDAPGALEDLVLQSDLQSGLLYRRIRIGTTLVPDPLDFVADWGSDPERYAAAFNLAPVLARQVLGSLERGTNDPTKS